MTDDLRFDSLDVSVQEGIRNAARGTGQDPEEAQSADEAGRPGAHSSCPGDASPSSCQTESPRPRRRPEVPSLKELRARLPKYTPSVRNREIFEMAMFDHKSQLDVGVINGVTQQRVAQICRHVLDWIAAWGGDEARYTLQERYRIASYLAAGNLDHLQRDVRFAIQLANREYHSTRIRSKDGQVVWVERTSRCDPPRAGFFAILLRAILATARLSGAEHDLPGSHAEAPDRKAEPQGAGQRPNVPQNRNPQFETRNTDSSGPSPDSHPESKANQSLCKKRGLRRRKPLPRQAVATSNSVTNESRQVNQKVNQT